jgi:hypoxanthine phosphoribosyltransferase
LVGSLAERIQASGFCPDRVVAIARGGYVPARLVCDRLNLYELDSIRVAHYRAGAAKAPAARLVSTLNSDIRACNVLLVDDVADTGDTLALAVEYLGGLEPRVVKVAVLQHKSQSPFIPDFCAEEGSAWRWLVYPWAVTEDLGGFLAAMTPAPDNPEQLVERLRREHGIKVSTRLAQQILEAAASRTASRPVG